MMLKSRDLVGQQQHGSVNGHLDTTSTNQTDVSLAATDLELHQVFKHTKYSKYQDSFSWKALKNTI